MGNSNIKEELAYKNTPSPLGLRDYCIFDTVNKCVVENCEAIRLNKSTPLIESKELYSQINFKWVKVRSENNSLISGIAQSVCCHACNVDLKPSPEKLEIRMYYTGSDPQDLIIGIYQHVVAHACRYFYALSQGIDTNTPQECEEDDRFDCSESWDCAYLIERKLNGGITCILYGILCDLDDNPGNHIDMEHIARVQHRKGQVLTCSILTDNSWSPFRDYFFSGKMCTRRI